MSRSTKVIFKFLAIVVIFGIVFSIFFKDDSKDKTTKEIEPLKTNNFNQTTGKNELAENKTPESPQWPKTISLETGPGQRVRPGNDSPGCQTTPTKLIPGDQVAVCNDILGLESLTDIAGYGRYYKPANTAGCYWAVSIYPSSLVNFDREFLDYLKDVGAYYKHIKDDVYHYLTEGGQPSEYIPPGQLFLDDAIPRARYLSLSSRWIEYTGQEGYGGLPIIKGYYYMTTGCGQLSLVGDS